jgi:hypothetical protein
MSRRNYERKLEAERRGIGQLRLLLILVGIVGLVLALGFVVMWSPWVLTHPPETEWQQETSKLHAAFESFHEKFGAYPPNFDDKERLAQFVKKAFPGYEPGVSTPYPESLDAAEAIVFWLGRINGNPKNPFAASPQDPESLQRFYQFAESRIRDGRYYPPLRSNSADDSKPFVYFAWSDYDTAEYEGLRPYARSRVNGKNDYFAPESCQIIVAGRDGKLGRGGLITELSEEDHDNVVNFSTQRVEGIARREGLTE